MNDPLISSLDRRVSDHDRVITNVQKDYTELSHEIKELLNRINNGVSPSVNAVRTENAEIKQSISNLSHKLDLGVNEMKGVVRDTTEHTRLMIKNFDEHKLSPVVKKLDYIEKTFIYGLIGAAIVFLGHRLMDVVWKMYMDRPTIAVTSK